MLEEIDITHHRSTEGPRPLTERHETPENRLRRGSEMRRRRKQAVAGDVPRAFRVPHEPNSAPAEVSDIFSTTSQDIDELRKAGLIADYIIEEDYYPPNNRTLQNFFRGSWSYHIHNQV